MSKWSHLCLGAAPCWNFGKSTKLYISATGGSVVSSSLCGGQERWGVSSGVIWTQNKHIGDWAWWCFFLHYYPHVKRSHVENKDSSKFKGFSGFVFLSEILTGIFFLLRWIVFCSQAQLNTVQHSQLHWKSCCCWLQSLGLSMDGRCCRCCCSIAH